MWQSRMKPQGSRFSIFIIFFSFCCGSCCWWSSYPTYDYVSNSKRSIPSPPPEGCCKNIDSERICFTSYGFPPTLPDCPEDFNPKFMYFDRSIREVGIPFTKGNITSVSAFTNNRKTVFIVHGFIDTSDAAVAEFMALKDKLLEKENLNVIQVYWKEGAKNLSFYLKAAANTKSMGALLGVTTNSMRARPGSSPYYWCIGLNIGAHVCGFAQRTATQKFDRITGLDPAGPLFGNGKGLNKNAALKVDVIHTSSFLGTTDARGHVDFFPNARQNQPGCPPEEEQPEGATDEELIQMLSSQTLGCNHRRAIDYMISSIENPNCYTATLVCPAYSTIPGSCSVITAPFGLMGYAATEGRYEGILYLQLSETEPYCTS